MRLFPWLTAQSFSRWPFPAAARRYISTQGQSDHHKPETSTPCIILRHPNRAMQAALAQALQHQLLRNSVRKPKLRQASACTHACVESRSRLAIVALTMGVAQR